MQDVLDRSRAVVVADQDGGVVGVEGEGALMGALLPDAEEPVDGAAAMGAGEPLVVGTELEGGRLGGGLDRVEGGGVNAIASRRGDRGGRGGSPLVGAARVRGLGVVVLCAVRLAADEFARAGERACGQLGCAHIGRPTKLLLQLDEVVDRWVGGKGAGQVEDLTQGLVAAVLVVG
jgi:hypothetical protein